LSFSSAIFLATSKLLLVLREAQKEPKQLEFTSFFSLVKILSAAKEAWKEETKMEPSLG
jgi:hypothetical protein